MDDIPAVFGLRYRGRAMCSQLGDKEHGRFLVGTQNLREENEVDLLEYHDGSNNVTCERVYTHPAEIWSLSSCPSRTDLFFSVYNAVETGYGTTLWRMPDLDESEDDENSSPLEAQMELSGHEGVIRSVMWHPAGELDHVVSLDEHKLHYWDLTFGDECSATPSGEQSDVRKLVTGAWDPFHTHYFATTHDTSIKTWDLRSFDATPAIHIPKAHTDCIRDIDFNPNKPYVIASAGDDGNVAFFDLRNTREPLKVLSEHSHWVWCVKYNPSFDQLVLSGSSDASVCLWSLPSISSAPMDVDGEKPQKDGLVKKFDDHEESVYAMAWNPCDAWSFVSLSYDGHLSVSRVPQETKYGLLLA